MTVGKMIELLAGKVCVCSFFMIACNHTGLARRVYWRGSSNMALPLEVLRLVYRNVSDLLRSCGLMRFSGRRYVSHSYRARIQLRRKGHAY